MFALSELSCQCYSTVDLTMSLNDILLDRLKARNKREKEGLSKIINSSE